MQLEISHTVLALVEILSVCQGLSLINSGLQTISKPLDQKAARSASLGCGKSMFGQLMSELEHLGKHCTWQESQK